MTWQFTVTITARDQAEADRIMHALRQIDADSVDLIEPPTVVHCPVNDADIHD